MLSVISKCMATPGQVVATGSLRLLNTWTHSGCRPLVPVSIHLEGFKNHMASKQSRTGDIDTILSGWFPCRVPASLDAHGSSTLALPLQRIYDPSIFITDCEEISVMNRNARRPKRANHGARPCSRSSRRFKKEKIGKRGRGRNP